MDIPGLTRRVSRDARGNSAHFNPAEDKLTSFPRNEMSCGPKMANQIAKIVEKPGILAVWLVVLGTQSLSFHREGRWGII